MDDLYTKLLPIAISTVITLTGIIIGYIQWRKDFKIKMDKLREEVTGEHIRLRVGPYSELMQQLEITSSIHQEEIIEHSEKRKAILTILQEAIYGPVGLLASHQTRDILVSARIATKLFVENKIEYEEWLKFPWILALSMRNDLGILQPNWKNEIDRLRRSSSDSVESKNLTDRWINESDLPTIKKDIKG